MMALLSSDAKRTASFQRIVLTPLPKLEVGARVVRARSLHSGLGRIQMATTRRSATWLRCQHRTSTNIELAGRWSTSLQTNCFGARRAISLVRSWNYPELNLAPEHPAEHSAADFLLRYLKDCAVWRRGQEPVEVATEAEREAIEKAQRMVQRKVSELEILIEANPTSNLLIAELGACDHHPMLRLAPVSYRRWLTPRYRIALSDDDPLTFATTLLDEYRHTYFAILRAGYSRTDAINWLKRRRQDTVDDAVHRASPGTAVVRHRLRPVRKTEAPQDIE